MQGAVAKGLAQGEKLPWGFAEAKAGSCQSLLLQEQRCEVLDKCFKVVPGSGFKGL